LDVLRSGSVSLLLVFRPVLGASREKCLGCFGSPAVCGCGCPVVGYLLAVLFLIAAQGFR
jgi:hypothetical protein